MAPSFSWPLHIRRALVFAVIAIAPRSTPSRYTEHILDLYRSAHERERDRHRVLGKVQ